MINFRNDDVLQFQVFSKKQRKVYSPSNAFEHFLKCDEPFAEHNYPCIIAVISDGIEHYPEWVQYIKDNQHRFTIELHGEKHYYYNNKDEEFGYNSLKLAKEKIEDTFRIEVSTWFIPYGRKKAPVWGQRVCDKLGLQYDTKSIKNSYMFHFWVKGQQKKVKNMIEKDIARYG